MTAKQIYNPCPKCGAELEMGFGLAGGGYGAYEYCTNVECDQFTKWPEEIELPEKHEETPHDERQLETRTSDTTRASFRGGVLR